MHKKKIKYRKPSFFGTLFHKPLLFFFILFFLPFLLWGTQQTQRLTSFGSNINFVPQSDLNFCPTTSSQSYATLPVVSDEARPADAASSPEINLTLRGYEQINEKKELVNIGGDTDPTMPPSLGTMFAKTPTIVVTYKVHKWDWNNNRASIDLESNWPVNLLGLKTSAGNPLVGPKAGRDIGDGNVLMLVFATNSSATFVHGVGDNPQDGYFIHIDNFCIDPNLLSTYNGANSSGRGSLPVIRTGQIFGYENGSDVRIAIRDSGDWMDPRSRKDWWQGSDAISGVTYPSPVNTTAPTPITQPPATNAPTRLPSSPTPIQVYPSAPITKSTNVLPPGITPTSFINFPLTVTPTVRPFMKVIKITETAAVIWSKIVISILNFTKIILP